MRAHWNGTTIAESDATIIIEGNHYFPPDSVSWNLLQPTETHSTCPWKGLASYWSVTVGADGAKDAAWAYPAPKDAAAEIKGYVAFWRGVVVEP